MRPHVRPHDGVDANVLAAISDAVGQALDPDLSANAADPDVAAAVQAALGAIETPPDRPTPRPEPQAALLPEPTPIPNIPAPEPEIVTRASSTGSRLHGVSLGPQTSKHTAERLLLRTALAELGTFDTALRRVVTVSQGYDARFAGMTEDQANQACARLAAREVPCETFGP